MQVVNFLLGPLDGQVEFYDDNEIVTEVYADYSVPIKVHDLRRGIAYYEQRTQISKMRYVIRKMKWDSRNFLIATPDYVSFEDVAELVKKGPKR